MLKTITVLLDGVGDRSYEELDWKTPLQYANTPNLDKLAKDSQCGLMTPHKIGSALGTDLAHFLLFGYSTEEYPGRAVIDAIGEGVFIDKNSLVLRASFANVTFSDGYFLNNRFTKDLSDKEISELCDSLKIEMNGYEFEVIHSYDSHCFIVVKGTGLSDKISDSDPFYTQQYVMAIEAFETDLKAAHFTANLINEYLKKSYDILNKHIINEKRRRNGLEVANILLTKWAGFPKSIESFYDRNGMSGVLLGQSKMLEGLSKYINMDYERYNSFEEGVELGLQSSAEYVHLHTKETDTASHKKNPLEKVAVIESLDKMIEPLLSFDGLLIVTADHSTPCSGEAIHSGESVPFMARGQYIRRDDVLEYNEVACSLGSVMLRANEFMFYIQNASDRGALYHLRGGNKRRNYKVRTVKKL